MVAGDPPGRAVRIRGRHAAPAAAVADGPRRTASTVAVISAAGVLLAAVADTAGRLGHPSSAWAEGLYWSGQALVLVPVAARLLSRRIISARETIILITILTVAEYLMLVCYSPAAFTYTDELAHWRSTVNLLHTGSPFTVNYLLPISPHYPGLEEAATALIAVTGLSVFTAGLIIAGVAHLLFVYVLFVLFRECCGSYRIAGVAILCYASNSLFESFDSMFVYQTLALPFLGLTVLAVYRLASPRASEPRAGWLTVAVLAIATAVVTHHVTSYVLVLTLANVALAALITGHRRTAAWAVALGLLSAVIAAAWLFLAAPQTWGYLQPVASQVAHSIRQLLAGGHTSAPPVTGPLGNQALAAAAVLAVSALLPAGWWQVWRRHRRQPWTMTMAIASAGWYVIVAVRLTVADGSELAGRASTFVFVPVAYIIALAVGHLASAALRRHARTVGAAVLVVVLLLMFDGLANGWPPYWERLPGPHQIAGAERSVGPAEIAAATWALTVLGPGNRFAADEGSYPVLGSYGYQKPLRYVAYLYSSPVFTPAENAQAQFQGLRYVLADRRLSLSLPASGRYFPVDPHAGKYTRPLPLAYLTAVGRAPGVNRAYDSGDIVIYQLAGT
ncbi:MAG: hypothetical protein ABJB47_00210 [Actinomycetota bacterium]